MVHSRCSVASTPAHARADADAVAFRIVLSQDHGFDKLHTREFDLALDSQCAVGRASRNTAKALTPAKHNMCIDSPVVSRDHATLTANTSTGAPHVFITDTKSMHGTFVNDTALVPSIPRQLHNGDRLRFGIDVNRNESEPPLHPHPTSTANHFSAGYFVAYSYTFNAELTDPEPFSRGFTVPEAESEEEELTLVHSGRGSRVDPLVLGDSDDDHDDQSKPDNEEQSEPENDITLVQATQIDGMDQDDEDDHCDEDEQEAAEDDVFNMVDISEDEDEDAADSIANDTAESELEEHAYSTAIQYSPASSPAHEAQHMDEIEEEWPLEELQEVPLVQPPVARSVLDQPYDYPPFPVIPQLELPKYPTFESAAFEPLLAPPLPPRPSQKRQRTEAPHEQNDWWFCVPPSLPVAGRMQTPPQTVPAEVAAFTFPSPVLEIKAPFNEVVDDQPPTPTSIHNHKRSADEAFSEENGEVPEQSATEPDAEVVASTLSKPDEILPEEVAIPTIEQVTVPSQRRIAQPRGIFSRALHAAKIVVPATALGAVFTITALTTLPESFFTVA